MDKKQRMYDQIRQHGENLKKIFFLRDSVDPVKLCKQLRRIELKGNRLATDLCNGIIDQDKFDAEKDKIANKLRHILEIPFLKYAGVFFNSDPRGYALKIESDRVRDFNLNIYRDMGGYGILAPEFTGE
jgi:hypothetical protein